MEGWQRMDTYQLIGQVAQRAGISSDQASTGVQMVGGFLKGKLPAGVGSQVDSLVGGQTITTPQLTQATTLDQIAGAISQRTGIPEGAAKTVVQTAGTFIADKVPPPFDGQVKSLLGLSEHHGGFMEQAKDALGGLFGHRH